MTIPDIPEDLPIPAPTGEPWPPRRADIGLALAHTQSAPLAFDAKDPQGGQPTERDWCICDAVCLVALVCFVAFVLLAAWGPR